MPWRGKKRTNPGATKEELDDDELDGGLELEVDDGAVDDELDGRLEDDDLVEEELLLGPPTSSNTHKLLVWPSPGTNDVHWTVTVVDPTTVTYP